MDILSNDGSSGIGICQQSRTVPKEPGREAVYRLLDPAAQGIVGIACMNSAQTEFLEPVVLIIGEQGAVGTFRLVAVIVEGVARPGLCWMRWLAS